MRDAGTLVPLVAVVLAAGQGTRLQSPLPKVLHRVGGRPMVERVVAAARAAGCDPVVVVIGPDGQAVREAVEGDGVELAVQQEQRGTGHALGCAEALVAPGATLVVLPGDAPLVRAETIGRLASAAAAAWGAMAVAELDDPGSLGRVLVGREGSLERIVEAADATPEELATRRVNAGFYALPAAELFAYLRRLVPDNSQGELYLTDALRLAVEDGHSIDLIELSDPDEALGVNTRADLDRVEQAWQQRRQDGPQGASHNPRSTTHSRPGGRV